MIHALLLLAVFVGCLWVAYWCLRHVYRAANVQPSRTAPASSPSPERLTTSRRR